MGTRDPKEIIAAYRKLSDGLGRPPSRNEFIRETDLYRSLRNVFGTWSNFLDQMGEPRRLTGIHGKIDSNQLDRRIRELEKELKEEKRINAVLSEASKLESDHVPEWVEKQRPKSDMTGIPLLIISDVHFDEVVRSQEVNGVNSYNRQVAVKRLQTVFSKTIELCKDYMAKPKYDGIVCALGGDMVSGNIHEELAETNEHRILRTCMDLAALLTTGIKQLADEFGKVYVPCVAGNHGRIHKKPRYKFRAQDNYDWLIYQMIWKELRDDKRITIHAPESPDISFAINGRKFLLTHGDQFKGGSGIAGVFSPLMLGAHRKQKRQQAFNKPFDVMIMGHWHQYIHTESLIVNGSTKGYDEYAFQHNFPFELPQQSLSIIRPDGEITYRMPVICEDRKNKIAEEKLVIWKD